MTRDEFIRKIIGAPWVNRKSDFDGCDCFGLFKLYAKCVLGYTINDVSGYEQNEDFADVFKNNIKLQWVEIDNYEKNAMAVFYTHGEPKHIAVCVGNNSFLHAHGSIHRQSTVSIVKTNALKRVYNAVTYHKLQAFE